MIPNFIKSSGRTLWIKSLNTGLSFLVLTFAPKPIPLLSVFKRLAMISSMPTNAPPTMNNILTQLADGDKKPLFIMLEDRYQHIPGIKAIRVRNMGELNTVKSQLMNPKAKELFSCIVFDTVDKLDSMIEKYVADLGVRLGLYKRIGSLKTVEDINDMREELIDRFGPIPEEVENLLKTVEIKQICMLCGIDRVEAGARGVLIAFHNNTFKNVDKLMDFISKQLGAIKIRPDQKLFIERDLTSYKLRLEIIKKYVAKLYELSL